ncbi:MAG: Xaa-Pro peptidase family protein [Nannocystaceae bacterium]|nr:Xaa-Pro peptidase family protein [Nannocystaceae bacterium]
MPTPEAVAAAPDFAALAGACEGVAAPDAAEWAEHRRVAAAAMIEQGIDAVVVEPGANLLWLTGLGWHRSERPLLALVRAGGELDVLCPAFETRTVLERVPELPLRPWREHEDPFAVLARAVPSLARARIAIDPSLRSFVGAGLRAALPDARWLEQDLVLGPARAIKRPAELARLRRANEVTKRAIEAVAQRVVVGTRQSEIAAWMHEALLATGMVEPWALALVGASASFPHGSGEDRAVAPGDVVLVDTGASLFGYRSDITRTWVVGEPDAAVRRAWQTVAAAQQAAFAAIRPGVRTGAVDAAARAVMAEAGYGADDRYFTHRLGHGIGLEVHEPPYLVGGGTMTLQPGMTMSNEPGIYVPGAFGVRIEDILLVTRDGADVFGPPVPPSLDVRPTSARPLVACAATAPPARCSRARTPA